MSSRNKRQELRAAKERRQKKIAIGGGVLLAVLLAIQVPKLMHHGSSAPTVSPVTSTTAGTDTTATPVATTPGVIAGAAGAAMTAAAPTAPTKLPNSDIAPLRRRTQLASFELFDSKDPFVQQVAPVTQAPASAALTPTTPGAPMSSSPPASTASGSAAPPPPATSATLSATQPNVPTRSLAHAGAAVIAVNGTSETISVNQTFPSANPTFKLVSLSNDVAMIGIANGGYASGAQTVALQLGKTLTLVDTTDSIRYELRLVSAS